MNNEIVNDNNIDNISKPDILAEEISPQADYYYDYRGYLQTIVNNQNTQNTYLDNFYKLVNEGFTFFTFFLAIIFTYCFVKNMIRK